MLITHSFKNMRLMTGKLYRRQNYQRNLSRPFHVVNTQSTATHNGVTDQLFQLSLTEERGWLGTKLHGSLDSV